MKLKPTMPVMTTEPKPQIPAAPQAKSVHVVRTQHAAVADKTNPLKLELGETLDDVTVAYQTYGQPNEQKTNAILICHALTGDAHVAGWHDPQDRKPGWWDGVVGPGKAIDTNHYFVICSNILGSRYGTTGPMSPNPGTQKPFGTDFPIVTIGDMVRTQARLLDHLGIERLHAVTGGSLGGMQALKWVELFPQRVSLCLPHCTGLRLTAQALALNAVARRAIQADLAHQENTAPPPLPPGGGWGEGNEQPQPSGHPLPLGEGRVRAAEPSPSGRRHHSGPLSGPLSGLGIARMLAHITYLSQQGMDERFKREPSTFGGPLTKFDQGFPVETYLDHQAQIFTDRFDPITYLYMTAAMDRCDVQFDAQQISECANTEHGAPQIHAVSYSTDWLYPSFQSDDIAEAAQAAGITATHTRVESNAGHDGFLVDVEPLSEILKQQLG